MGFVKRGLIFVSMLMGASLAAAQRQYSSPAQQGGGSNLQPDAARIFALANQERAQAGVGRLQWDPALAAAATYHCQRMAAEGPIAHQYNGEADLSGRAAQASAHFSMIEENVAVGPSADDIHQEWMHSQGHRENLLSADVDRVGIAVVAARGQLYAVADYSRGVEKLDPAQVEARVAALLRASGIGILSDPSIARAACATDEGMPRASGGLQPRFIMRWQAADLTRLPPQLADRIATGKYRQAAIGSCPAQVSGGAFTAYRLAVILY
jgi:hypothetical protein